MTQYFDTFFKNLKAPVSSKRLGLFRVLYGLVLLAEVWHLFKYRHLIFDSVPFIEPSFIDFRLPLLVWLLTIGCLVVGVWHRPVAIVNYVFSLIFFSSMTTFVYAFNYIMVTTNLLLIFLPVCQSFSISSFKNPNTQTIPRYILLFLFVLPVGFSYFDAGLYKLASSLWQSGWGVWVPASLVHYTFADVSGLLNNRLLMLSMSYGTLVFQLSSLFLIWFRWGRILVFVMGLLSHLGILIFFPIPLFALGVMCFYVLLDFDDNKTIQTDQSSGFVAKRYLYVLAYWVLGYVLVRMPMNTLVKIPVLFNKQVLGITAHQLFMDKHYEGYRQIFTIKHNGRLLPILNENGQIGDWLWNKNWGYWGYTVTSNTPDKVKLEKGIKRMTAFWRGKKPVNNTDRFDILVKNLDTTFVWQKDFLKNQTQKQWKKIGTATWQGSEMTIVWDEVLFQKNN